MPSAEPSTWRRNPRISRGIVAGGVQLLEVGAEDARKVRQACTKRIEMLEVCILD